MKDSDGNECSLPVLCRREPEWAANRIAALTAERDALKAEMEELKQQAHEDLALLREAERLTPKLHAVRLTLDDRNDWRNIAKANEARAEAAEESLRVVREAADAFLELTRGLLPDGFGRTETARLEQALANATKETG